MPDQFVFTTVQLFGGRAQEERAVLGQSTWQAGKASSVGSETWGMHLLLDPMAPCLPRPASWASQQRPDTKTASTLR